MALVDALWNWMNRLLLRLAGMPPTSAPGSRGGGQPDPGRRPAEAGYVTAEYAVGIIAAVAFAGVLLAVIKSGAVKGLLTSIIETALSM